MSMEQTKTPLTMEEKQQLMRERLGRNIGKIYEKPIETSPIPVELLTGNSPKKVTKEENKIVKGKEEVAKPISKSWRIELKITSVNLIYKLEIISKMHGKTKQKYLLDLIERDLVQNAELFKKI
jgi:hypothetical protein